MEKKVNLSSALPLIEKVSPKPHLFVNPNATLPTFYTYKGRLIEITKMKYKIQLNKMTVDEAGEEIRSALVHSLKIGDLAGFMIESSPTFNVCEFLKQFKWYNDKFFQLDNLRDKKFLLSSGILTEKEDYDHMNNKGFFSTNEKFTLNVISTCSEEDYEELKKNNSPGVFDYVLID